MISVLAVLAISATLEATVAGANDSFVRDLEAGDAVAASMQFADDALFIRPHNVIVRGRSAILSMFRDRLEHAKYVGGRCSTRSLESDGTTAWETGTCTYTTVVQGSRKTSTGHFVTVWKRGGDGQWRIAVNVAV